MGSETFREADASLVIVHPDDYPWSDPADAVYGHLRLGGIVEVTSGSGEIGVVRFRYDEYWLTHLEIVAKKGGRLVASTGDGREASTNELRLMLTGPHRIVPRTSKTKLPIKPKEPMAHFYLPAPKPGDTRPRNAFGIPLEFGEMKRAYYARLDAEAAATT